MNVQNTKSTSMSRPTYGIPRSVSAHSTTKMPAAASTAMRRPISDHGWFGNPACRRRYTVSTCWPVNGAIAPGMASRGHGSIVSLDSMAGHVGLNGGAAYGATKAALSALSRSWAAEFSPAGVRVNTVAPGPVYTSGASPERIKQLGSTTLLGRAAQVEEIA